QPVEAVPRHIPITGTPTKPLAPRPFNLLIVPVKAAHVKCNPIEAVIGRKGDRQIILRRFVYEKGGLIGEAEDCSKGLVLNGVDRFRYRTRYFTDSDIIGTKEFVSQVYQGFKGHFSSKDEKRPKPVKGLNGIYSLKRLSESV
ncbi:MAG: hypothetical protein ISS59_09000, partial [Desulfobacteraceae bacterium]|nr:hypothetical protein [Desulfobacteraceae bacterium]